jgi:hypothetical protein
MKWIQIIIIFFLSQFITVPIFAQMDNLQEPMSRKGTSFISAGVNQNAFLGLEISYWHSLDIKDKASWVYGKFELLPLLIAESSSFDTYAFYFGVNSQLLDKGKFLLVADFNVNMRTHKNVSGTFTPLGFMLKATPAIKSKNGFLGMQLKLNQTLVTKIEHSDYVKERFEDIIDGNGKDLNLSPKDGFFLSTGSFLDIGFETQFKLSRKLDMYFDIGWRQFFSPLTSGSDALMFGQLPVFTDLRVCYYFE